jgi:hypothetical protein
MKSQPTQKVSFERFEEMLCILPPKRRENWCFLVWEPQDHEGENNAPRYSMFVSNNGNYYDIWFMTVKQFEWFVKEKELICDLSNL